MSVAKFKSEKELRDAIGKYFEKCDKDKKIPSKAGLRVHLDMIKETYSDYKKRYPHPIKKAENLIEEAWVQRLNGMAATGAIFYLKNAFFEDYKDRKELGVEAEVKIAQLHKLEKETADIIKSLVHEPSSGKIVNKDEIQK